MRYWGHRGASSRHGWRRCHSPLRCHGCSRVDSWSQRQERHLCWSCADAASRGWIIV
jgi:hypothetical protein